MASLTGQTVASTYPILLKIETSPLNTVFKTVEAGDGTDSALQLATTGIKSQGTFESTGAAVVGGAITVTGLSTLNAGATITGAVTVSTTLGVTGVLTATGGVVGALTGAVTGNTAGVHTGAVTGNVTGNVTGTVSGNAGSATVLATTRNIALTGVVTGNANFDGSANISITTSGGGTITSVSDQANSSTGYLDLPVGTTAERPVSPASGNSRYNTTLAALEYYTGTAWESSATATSTLTQFNASGSAPVYACRAWVNFNGQGVVAIRASGNVSSITDNGTGDYTVNFTTAMSDANYTVATSGHGDVTNYNRNCQVRGTPTTSSVRVMTDGYSGLYDVEFVFVAIFR